jgi:hypothetical protein
MNIEQPPVLHRRGGRPPEEIDQLLGAFFSSEMPKLWPPIDVASPSASQPPRSSPRRWFWSSSRFALAATVGICLVGSMLVAAVFPSYSPGPRTTPARDLIAPSPYEEFQDRTPAGKAVRGIEKHEGKITIITIRRINTDEGDE